MAPLALDSMLKVLSEQYCVLLIHDTRPTFITLLKCIGWPIDIDRGKGMSVTTVTIVITNMSYMLGTHHCLLEDWSDHKMLKPLKMTKLVACWERIFSGLISTSWTVLREKTFFIPLVLYWIFCFDDMLRIFDPKMLDSVHPLLPCH